VLVGLFKLEADKLSPVTFVLVGLTTGLLRLTPVVLFILLSLIERVSGLPDLDVIPKSALEFGSRELITISNRPI
jgi:hypothetical protein